MKNEKKHIDRLFQEGLKNFEATPSHSVWENISVELLNNESQRKVIPLWMKLSAIAAGLLLLITLGNKIFFQNDSVTPRVNETIVDTELKNEQNSSKDSEDNFDSNTIDSSNINTENLAQEDLNSNEDDATEKSINGIKQNSKLNIVNKNESIVVENNRGNPSNTIKLNPITQKDLNERVATNTVANNSNFEKANAIESQKSTVKEELSKATNENITVAKVENTEQNVFEKEKTNEDGKMSIEDAIANNNKTEEEEDKLKQEELSKRWSVASNIAPVYFNSLGSGSSIHNEFINNQKSGNINVSYGVSASYAINDKINLRVGVNNVKLGYNTHDVFNSDNVANPIRSVIVKNIQIDESEPQALSYVSIGGMSFAQVPEPLSNNFNASLNQELGFLEIPLELQYSITDTKLGINVIGGFSALFLSNNEIYSTLDGNSTLIGKATNINNLSYSANLGLGLNYKVSNKINLNLEPMFKYQLNTFRNTSGNFKPYFIGVYSGLSFKF